MRSSTLQILFVAAIVGTGISFSGCSKAAKASRYTQRADSYFDSGDFQKAKIEYMNVLRTSGPSAKAIARLGEIWYEQGALLEAAPFLVRARELDGDNLANRLRLARTLTAVGQPSEARKEAAALLQQSPDNGEALLLLTEASVSDDDVTNAQQVISDFPQKGSAYYHLALAHLALRRGDIAQAEKAANDAIAADPKLPPAHMALGVLWSLKKDGEHARQEFSTAADLAPVRSAIRITYAEFLAQNGGTEEASKYLSELTKQAKDYFPAWTSLARLRIGAKQYDEALADVQHVLREDSNNAEALMLQAQAWLGKGQNNEAIAQLERLDQAHPNTPAVKYQLAQALLRSNNVPRATTLLEQAVAAAPNRADAVLLLAEINIRSGKAQAAIQPLENLVKTQPTLLQGSRMLAQAYRGVGRLDDAAAIFRQQIASNGNWAEPHYLLGVLLRDQKKNAEARDAFSKALQIEPQNPGPVQQLVDMDIADKQFALATERVQKALLAKDPNSAPAHFILGKILVAQQQWDAAEAELNRAIELDANLEVAYRLLVATYISSGKLQDAASRLEQLAAKNPKNTGALFALGMVYSSLKDYSKARDAYEKVLALQPDAAPTLNNLAFLYAEQFNDLNKAHEFASKARSIAPNDPHIADTLGWILYKRGDYQQASTLLHEAATNLADSADVQFHDGMASYMIGNTQAARVALEKAVNSASDFNGKDEARQRLAVLSSGVPAPDAPSEDGQGAGTQKPADPVVWMQQAAQFEKQAAFDKAADAYSHALESNPRLLPALRRLTELNLGPLQNSAKALEFGKRARQIDSNDPDIAALFGKASYAAGNFQQAYDVLQSAARDKRDDPDVLYAFAWAAYSVGREAEAKDAMKRVATFRNSTASADAQRFVALVEATSSDKGTQGAEGIVTEALAADPNYVPALMLQAWSTQQSDKQAAATLYNQVLSRFPDFGPAQKQLAALLADDPAQQAKAFELAMAARRTMPNDAELADTLVRLSYGRKDYRRVVQVLEQSQRQKPLEARSLFYLGMAQSQLNQRPAARDTLAKALAAGLTGPEADEANRVLVEISRQ